MSDTQQNLMKSVLLVVIAALVGGFSGHFYSQGQIDSRIAQLERDVKRVDENSASRRRELREEILLIVGQQQGDINQLRQEQWNARNGR